MDLYAIVILYAIVLEGHMFVYDAPIKGDIGFIDLIIMKAELLLQLVDHSTVRLCVKYLGRLVVYLDEYHDGVIRRMHSISAYSYFFFVFIIIIKIILIKPFVINLFIKLIKLIKLIDLS